MATVNLKGPYPPVVERWQTNYFCTHTEAYYNNIINPRCMHEGYGSHSVCVCVCMYVCVCVCLLPR